MIFSSSFFLTLILPLFLIIYFLINKAYKNIFLVVFSCFFYAWGAPKFIFVIIGTTLTDFFLVKWMATSEKNTRRKLLLALSVSLNLGLLFYFKYCKFFVDNINELIHSFGYRGDINWTRLVFPIGISFYTFETITYVVDVYRKIHKPLTRFKDYLLYIILFPKLIAGPIIPYHDIADQLNDRFGKDKIDNKLSGFYIFCVGLAKKVLIANTMGALATSIYGEMGTGAGAVAPESVTAATAWVAAIAYTIQIYFDFSGYSNMAIGLGKMLGFVFPENFNNPYISESITEFWRRWHITLGNWMKNYLYIPLGGNRSDKKGRVYFNLWLVFLISGFWHGASWNFIIWGIWHGTFLILERIFLLKVTSGIGRFARILFTLVIVILGWVMFRVEDVHMAFKYIAAMFGLNHGDFICRLSNQDWAIAVISLFFSWFCLFKPFQHFHDYFFLQELKLRSHFWLAPVCILLFILSLAGLAGNSFNSFIYFRF